MPYNFTGAGKGSANPVKLGTVIDGDFFTVGTDGYTVTSTLNQPTCFASNPVRSSAGVWSVPLLDHAVVIMEFNVSSVMPSGTYLSTQVNKVTTNAAGQQVLNWTFNVAGTPTDLPTSGSPGFRVFVVYSETQYVT